MKESLATEWNYEIYPPTGGYIYSNGMPLFSRVSDFNDVGWADGSTWEDVSLTFSAIQEGGGSSTWSGYKMVWSEGEAGTDIIVTFKDGSTKTFVTTNNKQWNCVDNQDEWSGWFIGYLDEGRYGNIYTGWCLYMTGGSDEGHYANVTADADATIEEICAGPWIADDYGSSNSIPTFTPSGSPAGWAKTDELVEGLAISGYTPKVGAIYNADTTVEVKRMFDGTTWDYVVYMPLEADSSVAATGQPITKIGSPVYAVSGGIECLKLDGESGLVIADSGIDLAGDLTICFKVYYDNLNDGVLFHLGTSSNNDLLIMNGGSSSWIVGTAAGSGDIHVNTDITTGKWYNIVIKRESGKLVFYQDGVLTHSEDWGITLNSSGKLRIGHGFWNGNNTWFFTGYLAKFMVFNRALSADDITKVFV